MWRSLLAHLSLVALACWLGAPPLAAQTAPASAVPRVFFACYVPAGVVYRIREPGLPQQCFSARHIEFSWTDGLPGHDHGALNGLPDDDHPQYLLADGARSLTGPLSLGGNKVTNLAPGREPGDAVRFDQAIKNGDAAAGDLTDTYPSPTVAGLQGTPIAATAPTSGQVLTFSGTEWTPAPLAFPGTLQSPNGLFALKLTDAGIELKGPSSKIVIDAVGVSIAGDATVSLVGAIVTLNGSCAPVARVGDAVQGTASPGFASGTISTRVGTVMSC